MNNPFFSALEGDGFKASELASQTKKVLLPFMYYLNNSIKALENKEVSCTWRPVANKRYRLKVAEQIYSLTPISEINIILGDKGWYEILEVDENLPNRDFVPNIDHPITCGKGANYQSFSLVDEHYQQTTDSKYKLYLPNLHNIELIQWSGYQLLIRPLCIQLDELNLDNVYVDSQACPIKTINNNTIQFYGVIHPHSVLSINGQDTEFELISSLDENKIKSYSPMEDGNRWLLFSQEKPILQQHQIKNITLDIISKLTPEHLVINGHSLDRTQWNIDVDKTELILECKNTESSFIYNSGTEIQCERYPALSFNAQNDKIDEKWVQLIEKDSGDDTGKSELDYFFGDYVKVLDNTQRKNDDGFKVIKSRPEERQILLARNSRGKKNWQSEYPSTQSNVFEIRVSVDTSQLQKQKNAINQLMSRPTLGHTPLIHLLQNRSEKKWKNILPKEPIDWQVLTDPNFDGCDRQRDFVTKALVTPDFAILDGPPGTGKTTTILELIIQLVMEGKRVLLSASTHAAINNILERVQENATLSEHIFPLRIGDKNNAVGVEEYQFDDLYQNLKLDSDCQEFSAQIMVDSANLVCGTTIGILRLFNEREVTLDCGEPPFDVVIIDECSKTTFQEFLVPARFAKRWILVGDVRQLSPFTDREQIVANLDNLILVPPRGKVAAETLSPAIQQACYLLEEFRGNNKNHFYEQQPILMPVSSGILNALNSEIIARKKQIELSKGLENINLIKNDNNCSLYNGINVDHLTYVSSVKKNPLCLYEKSLCFVDEACIAQIQPIIPDDMLILHPDWQSVEHAFYHRATGKMTVKPLKIKKEILSNSNEIYHSLLDRLDDSRWSEEVCWRLEREYWLRLSKDSEKAKYYSRPLERLFPKSVNADGRIHMLKNIAFPSILEALSGDGLTKRKNEDPTTLNQGFFANEKQHRYSTLNYQHRMHPDISAFPRQQFYPEGVLMNGNQTQAARRWDYQRYQSHCVWINAQGKVYKNTNLEEVKVIITELKAFCAWAEHKKKNAKGEAFDVAILTFYKGQEKALREAMQKQLPGNGNQYARFSYKGISIKLATVDYFQGQEADVVFLSMVNVHRDGFMDSPNRLNVAITRARYQLVVVGYHNYFSQRSKTIELEALANACHLTQANNNFSDCAKRNKK